MLRYFFIVFSICLMGMQVTHSQDLQNERIRALSGRKRSIYLDRGIFHNGSQAVASELTGVRYNFSNERGYERVVFDFSTAKVPKIYGHISSVEKKIYIDFFDTKIAEAIKSLGESKYVESLNFFPITNESLSVELNLKENLTVDIFYLEGPGRLVIDIKK